MIKLAFKAAKEGFFDREKVVNAMDKASVKVLSKFGAFVRTRARSSMRRTKKTSLPGNPPSAHVGFIKTMMFFSYDKARKSVVIGPTLINRSTNAQEILEYGGDTILEGYTFTTRDGKRTHEKTTKRIKIKKRPYMKPAFEAEKQKLAAMWANSVR